MSSLDKNVPSVVSESLGGEGSRQVLGFRYDLNPAHSDPQKAAERAFWSGWKACCGTV